MIRAADCGRRCPCDEPCPFAETTAEQRAEPEHDDTIADYVAADAAWGA